MLPELPAALKLLLDRPAEERTLGAFVLVEQLGRGGFAPVWLAREVYEGKELRTAAVKLFALARPDRPPEGGEPSDSDAARHKDHVIDEARAICRVEHPNVVRFYSLLLDETRGVIGLAMEYVAGTPLDRRIRASRGGLAVSETIDVGIAVASALAAVHAAGLVHRDVKPANVVEKAGVHKLIDFGIAAAEELSTPASRARTKRTPVPDLATGMAGQRASTLTHSYTIRDDPSARADTVPVLLTGTIGYIDPVCLAQGAPATPASDLYGLGALLYECLTTRLPAQSVNPPRLRGDILSGAAHAPSLVELSPEAPEALVRLVDRLLAPERSARPASATSVVDALVRLRNADAEASRAPAGGRAAIAVATVCIALAGTAGAALLVKARRAREAHVPVPASASAARATGCAPADPAGCQRSCDDGDADACHALGLLFGAGSGVGKDEARAALMFRKGCDGGSAAACYSLAGALERGAGVPQDDAEALARYTKACDAGNAQACSSVGRFEEAGRATAVDPARALEHYARACDGGYDVACSNEGLLYEAGDGVARDLVKARALFERACAGNAVVGCGHLGRFYEDGVTVDRDAARAADLFTRACDAGQIFACARLARLYRAGEGVARDEARAVALYRKACDANDATACASARPPPHAPSPSPPPPPPPPKRPDSATSQGAVPSPGGVAQPTPSRPPAANKPPPDTRF